jgi:hypothetical protein
MDSATTASTAFPGTIAAARDPQAGARIGEGQVRGLLRCGISAPAVKARGNTKPHLTDFM